MILFKGNNNIQRFQGVQHFSWGGGGPTFSRGSNCLIPIETHITVVIFHGVRSPCPPSGSAHVRCVLSYSFTFFF